MDELDAARTNIDRIDRRMAELFCARMKEVERVADYKAAHSLPIFDASRELELESRASDLVKDETLRKYYIDFIKSNMSISRSYQAELYPQPKGGVIYDGSVRKIRVGSRGGDYDVILGRGLLSRAGEYFDLGRRVLIVTDDGVPSEYALKVLTQCKDGLIHTIPQGEGSKSLTRLEELLRLLADSKFGRGDCVIAVGGGVVGDLAGLAAATYMRGIDFYNVPTTLLSQVDSSIGGKVAVDLGGYKNTVGAFYPPRGVIIDTELLLTLDAVQLRCGLAEALKMAVTSDAELFSLFESGEFIERPEDVIERALLIKRGIVERDERESGERRILNFGHTVGHAIESASGLPHGLCVAIGMLYTSSPDVRQRLLPIYHEIGLPTHTDVPPEELYRYILLDKKAQADEIILVLVNEIGRAELRATPIKDIRDLLGLFNGKEKK